VLVRAPMLTYVRNAKKIKTLNMHKDGKAQRNAEGKITKAASYQSREVPKARVEPNRKWFGNTRVISQNALDSFRQAVAERAADPYQVLLKTNKLPMSLIRDAENTKNGIKQHQAKIAVDSAPFADTFGPKSQRKRVKLSASSVGDLANESVKMHDNYLERLEENKLLSGQTAEEMQQRQDDGELRTAREPIFSKGQSKRIWNELYKVIDSSDVVIHVLDGRDPEGTRCRSVERYIREEAPHKHLVFVLNKTDLVPTTIAVSAPFFSGSDPFPSLSQGSFLRLNANFLQWKQPVTALVDQAVLAVLLNGSRPLLSVLAALIIRVQRVFRLS
jgi:nuclear GTP-binding protein